ncbi:hypothetical protein ACVIGA_007549 [Bradyrhizobium sp. USDA 3240]
MSRLGYVLPDRLGASPLDTIPFVLGVADCAISVAESVALVAAAGETAFSLLMADIGVLSAPGVAAVGSFMALGASYDEAKRDIQDRETIYGFSLGLVMGSDGVTPKKGADYFGHRHFTRNVFLEGGARYAADAYKQGLLNGYMQGRGLTANQKMNLWKDLLARGKSLPGWNDFRGQSSQSKQWSSATWVNYYLFFAAVFRKFHTVE